MEGLLEASSTKAVYLHVYWFSWLVSDLYSNIACNEVMMPLSRVVPVVILCRLFLQSHRSLERRALHRQGTKRSSVSSLSVSAFAYLVTFPLTSI